MCRYGGYYVAILQAVCTIGFFLMISWIMIYAEKMPFATGMDRALPRNFRPCRPQAAFVQILGRCATIISKGNSISTSRAWYVWSWDKTPCYIFFRRWGFQWFVFMCINNCMYILIQTKILSFIRIYTYVYILYMFKSSIYTFSMIKMDNPAIP